VLISGIKKVSQNLLQLKTFQLMALVLQTLLKIVSL